MRTAAVILLLLVMLAPRLVGAALPHELACAGLKPHTMTQASGATTANVHPHHEQMAAPDHAGMHSHHHMPMAEQNASGHDEHADASTEHSSNDSGNCQHCGDCDDHCSAVLLTALPRLNLLYSPTPLAALIATSPITRPNDLNRPPRTTLS